MARIWWRAGFVCLVAGALALGSAVVGFLHPRAVEADEGDQVRLLVKCGSRDLEAVLAALAGTKAEVWDLGTMKRVDAAPRVPGPPTPTHRTFGAVPPLRDAGQVMEAILASVGEIQGRGKAAPPRVTELAIQSRGATITLVAGSGWEVDQVRLTLATNAWLKPRLVDVETGAAQRRGDGIQTTLHLKFDTSHPEPGSAQPLTQLDMQVIEQAVHAVKMQYVRAGAVASEADRQAGYVTTWRDFTFQTAKLTSLRALIMTLAKAHPGLVVFEVHYKDNGSGYALDPVLRVGGRAPLGR